MIAIRYSGVIFAAGSLCPECEYEKRTGNPAPVMHACDPLNTDGASTLKIRVCAQGGKHIADIVGEEQARRWLGDHGCVEVRGAR